MILAIRAQIVLLAIGGREHGDYRTLWCNAQTVGTCRRRFAEQRLDGLYDEPRQFLREIVADVPSDPDIDVVMDN
ncbi:hypothetical protein [Mesorhizobium sp. M0491]|uniref:hypothetical protein n=1 Tax=Mesorhizobium sp. M0491 TaxID=2956950 RepID=UPI0033358ED2